MCCIGIRRPLGSVRGRPWPVPLVPLTLAHLVTFSHTLLTPRSHKPAALHLLVATMYAVYNEGSALQAEDSALGSESEAALQEPDDIKGQALEILAGLTSLGISQDLRDKVQSAIQALDEASASATAGAAGSPGGTGPGAAGATGRWGPGAGGRSGKGAGPGGAAALEAAERQVDALEKKLAMSRNIMRKLYHKVRAARVRVRVRAFAPSLGCTLFKLWGSE